MGHAMIWIEGLATALLFVAMAAACAARWRRGRVAIPMCVAVLSVVKGAVIATVFAAMAGGAGRAWYFYGWFLYWASWAVAAGIGAAIVLNRGVRRRGEVPAAAASWPRGKLAVAFAAVLVLVVMTFWNMELAVRGMASGLRAQAETLALSAAPVRIPDDRNAALVYDEAFDLMVRDADRPPEWSEKWIRWPEGAGDQAGLDAADPKLTALLVREEAALAQVRRAAAMPDCIFGATPAPPNLMAPTPEFARFRRAAQDLVIEARVRLARGDAAGALEDTRAIFGMARQARGQAKLLWVLIGLACERMGARTLEGVLASGEPKAADLASVGLESGDVFRRAFGPALGREEACGIGLLTEVGSEDVPVTVGYFGGAAPCVNDYLALYWRVYLELDEVAAYRGALHEYQNAVARPYPVDMAVLEGAGDRGPACGGLFVRLLLPAISSSVRACAEGDAEHGLVRLALAAARYRAEKGKLPGSLDELAPAYLPVIPRDPFDGKPLRMAARDGGLVLYSIGRDLRDDGGTPWNDAAKTGDIVFRLGAAGKAGAK